MPTNSIPSKNRPAASFTLPDSYRNILVLTLLVSAGGMMAWISWLKWPDLLVDFGEQVHVSWQVAEGRILYQDLAFAHGPLSIYLHALIFKLLGPGFLILALFNIGITAALSFLIYIFIKKTSDQLTATVCSLAFLTLFAFGQYKGGGNFNFITPYVYELSHGVALSFLSLYLFSKYIEAKTLPWLAGVFITAGLVFLTKAEVFLAILIALSAGTALSFYLQSLDKVSWARNILVCIGAFLAGPFLFLIYFSLNLPFEQALTYLVSPWIYIKTSSPAVMPLYQWVMGLGSPGTNLTELLKYFFLGISVIALTALVNRFLIQIVSPSKSILISAGMLAGVLLFKLVQLFPLMELFRPLPLIALSLTLYYLTRIFKNKNSEREKFLILFAFSLFSFALLLKIILNTHIYHYGFALALPATLVTLRWALYELPNHKKFFSGSADFYRSAMVVLGLAIIASHIALGHQIHQLKTYPVGSGWDTIIEYSPELDPRGPIVADTLHYIQNHIEPNIGIATLPYGNMINYMSRHPNPLRIHSLNPVEAHIYGEQQYLDDMKNISPEYVLLVDIEFTILGARYFGQDYAQDIYLWIRKNYSVQKQFGAEPFAGKGFGIQILKRTGWEIDERF